MAQALPGITLRILERMALRMPEGTGSHVRQELLAIALRMPEDIGRQDAMTSPHSPPAHSRETSFP